MSSFLEEMFQRLGGAFKFWEDEDDVDHPTCSGTLDQAVEHVVDETYSRLRFLSGYSRRLRGPVAATVRYIDELVEGFPPAMLCSRSAYSEDLRVNAFFAGPKHLQEVFSENEQVHALFDNNLDANECWALLCVRKAERRQLGVTLVGDAIRKDVMQTVVNFIDHQVVSPAASEAEARRSLKCCIFNGLLAHIKKRASEDRIRVIELENRRESLLSQRKWTDSDNGGASRVELQREIDEITGELARDVPRLASLDYHFDLVADVLGNPAQFVSGSLGSIHLNRLGIKLEAGGADSSNEIPLFEIEIASQGTRVGALVRFPRAELLPRQDFVRKADLFLAQ